MLLPPPPQAPSPPCSPPHPTSAPPPLAPMAKPPSDAAVPGAERRMTPGIAPLPAPRAAALGDPLPPGPKLLLLPPPLHLPASSSSEHSGACACTGPVVGAGGEQGLPGAARGGRLPLCRPLDTAAAAATTARSADQPSGQPSPLDGAVAECKGGWLGQASLGAARVPLAGAGAVSVASHRRDGGGAGPRCRDPVGRGA